MSLDAPRRIIVLRHAKADWPDVPDHERPLADRGRKEAPESGQWLAASGILPDLVLCSTATRTRETWKLFSHELSSRPRTVYEDRLYEASPGELVAIIQETSDEVSTLLLVGHNPGVQGLTQVLSGSHDADTLPLLVSEGFPTAGVAVLEFTGPWKGVEPGTAHLASLYVPGTALD
jgi:phosphohistidine phosphatase